MTSRKFIIIAILVGLLAISAVSANDLNTTDADDSVLDDTLSVSESEVIAKDSRTFTDLQSDIDDASQGSTIVLDTDYNYDDSFSIRGITINKALTIDGKGHTLNGLGQSHILYVSASNVVLKNINFINGYAYDINEYDDSYNYEMGGAIQWQGTNGKLINCNFENNNCTWDGGAVYWNSPGGTIDGCTFKANYADYGGALKCENGENLELLNSVFIENYANSGGAISWFGNHTGLVKNCIFEKNSAGMGGAGVIYAFNFTMINSTFKENSATGAGALVWDGNNGLLIDSTFTGNIAKYESEEKLSISNNDLLASPINEEVIGGAPGCGGAIIWFGDNSVINNCKFTENIASGDGGAVFSYIYNDVPMTNFTNCIFDKNHADSTGGAFKGKGNCSVIDSSFTNNDAVEDGGAIYWDGSDGFIKGSTFSNNKAKYGGALYSNTVETIENCDFYKNAANYGGAVFSANSEIYIRDSSFVENSANNDGGALYLSSALTVHSAIDSIVQRSEFKSNSAKVKAGAIYSERDLQIGCTSFEDNSADVGGAIYTYDGTVHYVVIQHYTANGSPGSVETVYYKPNFRLSISGNSSFKRNNAVFGGAIDIGVNEEAYAYNITGKLDIYEGTVFYNNTADCGGALHLVFTDLYIDRAEFKDNSARIGGAMEVVDYSTTEVFNSVFKNNFADEFGGTIVAQFNLGLYGNNFTSQNQEAVYYTSMDGINTGEMCLKNNRIQTKSSTGIVFDSDTMISSPTKLIFEDQTVLTGNKVKLAKFVDDNGNVIKVDSIKAKITKDSKVKDYLDLNYDDSVGGFSYQCDLEQGTYKVTGYVTSVAELDCSVIDGVLTVTDIVLTAKDVTTYYGSNDKFTVTLSDNKGNAISNSKVRVTIGNKNHDLTTDSKGQASVVLDLAVGEYDVTSTYDSLSIPSKVTVKSTITAKDVTGTYLNSKATATFLDTAGKALASKQVTFKIGTSSYAATTNSNGVAAADIPLGVGTYTVTAINPANNEQKQFKLTISKASSTTALTASQNENGVTLTATITPNAATGKVTFDVGSKTYSANVNSGKATVTIPDLAAGTYQATASYGGDSNLLSSKSTSTSFKVAEVYAILTADDVNKVQGGPEKLTITLKDSKGNAIANANVNVDLNGATKTLKTDSNGKSSMDVNLAAGNYVAVITFDGAGKYSSVSKTVNVNVQKSAPILTAESISFVYGNVKGLIINLNDEDGTPVPDKMIYIDIGGYKYAYSAQNYTDENGQIILDTKGIAPDEYDVDIKSEGCKPITVKMTVKKATPKITASKKTFKVNVKTKKYTITLKTNKNKVMKNKKVTLKVNGKTYKATTNSKGKATFKITKLTKKGTYKATVTYKGSEYYKKATKKVKITVKTVFKTVSKGSKDSKTVKKIQRALKNNGYYLSAYGHYLKVDGIFHIHTENAVKQFQKDNGLKVTGKVDEKTAKKLKII